MVAARSDFLSLEPFRHESGRSQSHAFTGSWQLDRVSGLIDATIGCIERLVIDEDSLQVDLRPPFAAEATSVVANMKGETADVQWRDAKCCMQALLEGDVLVWELLYQTSAVCQRVRRVMRISGRGGEIIVERVDMNPEGVPTALRTEYWMRLDTARGSCSQ